MSEEEKSIVTELEAQYGAGFKDIGEKPLPEQLPRMKATLRVENAFLNRSGASGRKQMTATCIIVESSVGEEYVGQKYSKTWGLETDENMQWFNRDLRALDLVAPTKPSGLLEIAAQLVGVCFVGALVPDTDGDYPPNCFINRNARRTDLEGGKTTKPNF